eukprot:1159776-Pelagomonas_calceolata.AAC.9
MESTLHLPPRVCHRACASRATHLPHKGGCLCGERFVPQHVCRNMSASAHVPRAPRTCHTREGALAACASLGG